MFISCLVIFLSKSTSKLPSKLSDSFLLLFWFEPVTKNTKVPFFFLSNWCYFSYPMSLNKRFNSLLALFEILSWTTNKSRPLSCSFCCRMFFSISTQTKQVIPHYTLLFSSCVLSLISFLEIFKSPTHVPSLPRLGNLRIKTVTSFDPCCSETNQTFGSSVSCVSLLLFFVL